MERNSIAHTTMEDGYHIQKLNNNLYSVINKEMNVDIQIKIEEDEEIEEFETDLIVINPELEIDSVSGKELYQDHLIKEELVIGPEEIQEHLEIPYNNNNIHKRDNIKKRTGKNVTYQCDKCKDTFQTKHSLVVHRKDVHAEKICQYCQKEFNKTSNLKRHQNYSCPNNESVEKNNAMLKYGMYKHPFICDFCQKSYTHKNTLRDHIRRHMGVPRSYSCKLCDKSYTKSHNLTCHMRSAHLKVQSYSCKFCMKRFNWRYSLTNHEKTYHKNCRIKT